MMLGPRDPQNGRARPFGFAQGKAPSLEAEAQKPEAFSPGNFTLKPGVS